jgi:hypothetical protein
MIFADFCSLRMASFERDLLPARSHLVVVALGNKDHCGKVEGGGRNGGSQQWEWKRIERRASELRKNVIERHPACNRGGQTPPCEGDLQLALPQSVQARPSYTNARQNVLFRLLSRITASTPVFASNCPSSRPDGPKPTITTWVRMLTSRSTRVVGVREILCRSSAPTVRRRLSSFRGSRTGLSLSTRARR